MHKEIYIVYTMKGSPFGWSLSMQYFLNCRQIYLSRVSYSWKDTELGITHRFRYTQTLLSVLSLQSHNIFFGYFSFDRFFSSNRESHVADRDHKTRTKILKLQWKNTDNVSIPVDSEKCLTRFLYTLFIPLQFCRPFFAAQVFWYWCSLDVLADCSVIYTPFFITC